MKTINKIKTIINYNIVSKVNSTNIARFKSVKKFLYY